MKVGIVGAGIGGACLAHGLAQTGIDVTVFERNPGAELKLPGYGIHVNADGQRALRACLPQRAWAEFARVSEAVDGETRFLNEHLELLASRPSAPLSEGTTAARVSISRAELARVLREGLASTIRHSKEFIGYSDAGKGQVALHFSDASTHVVDVLVGADGPRSRVRSQYLPKIERLDLGISTIVGRSRLTPDLARRLPATLTDGSANSIVPTKPGWMFASVWDVTARGARQNCETRTDKYVVWAYVTRDRHRGENRESAKALIDDVLTATHTWDERIRYLVRQTEEERVTRVSLRTMPRLPAWQATNVTVLGDAIHNMTPMAGVGANTALRDAESLTRALIKAASGKIPPVDAIADYESAMRVYANEAIALSWRNAENAADESRVKRAAFRTLLRSTRTFPSLGRLLFPAYK